MLDYLHSELLYLTSKFLEWNDLYYAVKHTNKRLQYNVTNNKKIIRRKSLVYMRILQQQLHFRKLFARPDILSSYNPRKRDFVHFWFQTFREINVSSLSKNQKDNLIKMIRQFDEYYPSECWV